MHTYCSSQAHDDEQQHTPQDISVETPLQLAALVPRPAVVHHGFGFVAWSGPQVEGIAVLK